MKSLFLILFFLINQFCLAQDNNNNLSASELQSLKSELSVIEKENNQKYQDIPDSEKFIRLFSQISASFGGLFGNSSSKVIRNVAPKVAEINTPTFDSASEYELYSQKLYFKKAIWDQKYAKRKAINFRRKAKQTNDFASQIKYDL